jgi:hypothetical protein
MTIYRSTSKIRIGELIAYIFTYATKGQQSNYIRTKEALPNNVGTTFKFAKALSKAINMEKKRLCCKNQRNPPATSQPRLR